jgi:hypothetical protein
MKGAVSSYFLQLSLFCSLDGTTLSFEWRISVETSSPSSFAEDFPSLELKYLLVLVVPDNLGLPADLGLVGMGSCMPVRGVVGTRVPESADGGDERANFNCRECGWAGPVKILNAHYLSIFLSYKSVLGALPNSCGRSLSSNPNVLTAMIFTIAM